jgi:hypothetical protein
MRLYREHGPYDVVLTDVIHFRELLTSIRESNPMQAFAIVGRRVRPGVSDPQRKPSATSNSNRGLAFSKAVHPTEASLTLSTRRIRHLATRPTPMPQCLQSQSVAVRWVHRINAAGAIALREYRRPPNHSDIVAGVGHAVQIIVIRSAEHQTTYGSPHVWSLAQPGTVG